MTTTRTTEVQRPHHGSGPQARRGVPDPAAAPLAGPTPASGRWRAAAAGARRMLPLVVAYVPFALTIGAEVARHDDPAAAWAGSLLIFGGSAQLAVVQLTASGSAVVVVVATGLLIHSRLLAYGLSMAPRWRGEPRWFRLLAAASLIDPTWAMAQDTFSADGDADRRPDSDALARATHLGAVATLAVGWVAAITAGVAVGPGLLAGAGLELAAPLCLLALVIPRAATPAGAAAAAAGAVVAGATAGLPAGSALLLAVVVGAAAGRAVDQRRDERREPPSDRSAETPGADRTPATEVDQ